MRKIRSSCKAALIIVLFLFNTLIVVPQRVSGGTSELEFKFAPDVKAKLESFKSQQKKLEPTDGLFDLLKELLEPVIPEDQTTQNKGETLRLIVQTSGQAAADDLKIVESLGGRIINPAIRAFDGMVIDLPVGSLEEFARSQRIGRIALDRKVHLFFNGQKKPMGDSGGSATTSHLQKTTGAYQIYPWNNGYQGVDGSDIGIAVIDSGISPVTDFDESQIVNNGSRLKLGDSRIDYGINFADDLPL